MVSTAVVLGLLVAFAGAHRMCLDYSPPYQMDETFDLCRDFEKFGCCDKQKDGEIYAKYLSIINQLSPDLKKNCSDVIRDLLCQECSEYSAHQFDFERSGVIASLPGLCDDYCKEIFRSCRDALTHLTNETKLLRFLREGNEKEFCKETSLVKEEKYYCYPLKDEFSKGYLTFYQLPNEKPCMPLCIEEVANKMRSPVSIRHAGDNTHRIFVAEQMGLVWVFLSNWTKIHPPFLNKTADVNCKVHGYDERGFLDIQFHPQYSRNGLFYVYYSSKRDSQDTIRISEMKVLETDMNRADPSYERVLLEIDQPYANHNGGQLLFDDDGYLYIFVGDGGSAGDPHGHAQNKSSLLGNVLRVDVTPTELQPYSIPPSNPFVTDSSVEPEIYAYGLRNPWRCTFEPQGRLICADIGQHTYEEIDIIIKGGNYGWRAFEGDSCYDDKMCNERTYIDSHIPPIHAYNNSWGKSVTGGYVYNGCISPKLRGKYIYGDFMSGRMGLLKEGRDGKWEQLNVCMHKQLCSKQNKQYRYPRYILTYGEDESGEVYFASTPNPKPGHNGGRIYKITHAYKTSDPASCRPSNVAPTFLAHESWLEEYKPTPDREIEIRLVGADQGRIATKGRVEMRPKGGRWSTICGKSWTLENAHVVCRMMDFTKAREYSIGEFGPGRGRVRFDHLECNGLEDHIDECVHSGWEPVECSHDNDASVWCESYTFS